MSEEERSRFLTMIDADVRRMERLVKKLIELTRIEITDPTDETSDLKEIISHLVHRYVEAGHSVTFIKLSNQKIARVSPEMAETLFVNLIENAVTHGKGTLVTVTLKEGPTVEVKDEGPGISEGNLSRIFDRFFTTTRETGGTGLGLAMVKAIINAYEAEIDVDSSSKGTVFRIRFN